MRLPPSGSNSSMYARLTLLCSTCLVLAALVTGAPPIDPAGIDGEVALAGPDAPEEARERAAESKEKSIPGVVVHIRKADEKAGTRFPKALKASEAKVGIEIAPDAALSVKGRTMRVLAGEVRLYLAGTNAV